MFFFWGGGGGGVYGVNRSVTLTHSDDSLGDMIETEISSRRLQLFYAQNEIIIKRKPKHILVLKGNADTHPNETLPLMVIFSLDWLKHRCH